MESEKTREEQRQQEAKDTSTDFDLGSGGGHGPPATGERGDPKRDPESGVPRERPEPEPGDLDAKDDPTLGKETHGS